jgi:ribonuclease P protein subunit RPR2
MGKAKNKNGAFRVPNRQNHARISFLYQAATYLTNIPYTKPDSIPQKQEIKSENSTLQQNDNSNLPFAGTSSRKPASHFALSQYYASQIATIARKAQFKISPNLKRTICRGCKVVLITGSTSTSAIENLSHNGEKPWADVLIITCNLCGMEKRYPLQSKGDRSGKKHRLSRAVERQPAPS